MEQVELSKPDLKRAQVSKLLRRTSFGIRSDRLEQFANGSYKSVVNTILAEQPAVIEPPISEGEKEYESTNELTNWWLESMATGGLHEKMTWFWHSLLTTHRNDAGGFPLIKRQLTLLRTHALGNYRTLLHEFVKDGSLLFYLDGNGSTAANPNENLGRELMELFTLGVGNYTEDDVKAAARALAGWQVDRETYEVTFDPKRGFVAPLIFRGVQDTWDTEKVVDSLLDDEQTAANISRQVWFHLGGGWLSDDDAARLGRWWLNKGYEIKPLIERALLDSEESYDYQRPKYGLEFFYSYASATNMPLIDGRHSPSPLGQLPYQPPNVAGWPADDRWVDSSQMLVRAHMAWNIDQEQLGDVGGLTSTDALRRCGIYAVSSQTSQALAEVENSDLEDPNKSKALLSVAIASPEFQLL